MKIALALVLTACSFPTPSKDYACDTTADCEGGRVCVNNFCVVATTMPDAPVIETDAPPMFDCTVWMPAPRHFMPCNIPEPVATLTLANAGTYTYNTTTGMLADPSGAMTSPPNTTVASGRVISVLGLTVGTNTTLRVVGMQPLIIASWSTLAVQGTIDAGSTALLAGAGADAACTGRTAAPGGNNDSGAGGGGGGGFRAIGGTGGDGDAAAGGAGGGAIAVQPLLLGGCPGANGGTGNQAGGIGGRGGGAVQLTAKDSISITGKVLAGGAGGGGATATVNEADGGGGGGGSGGMVGLEAPMITLATGAVLAANGGGGGAGVDSNPGAPGQDGQPSATRATGGTGNNAGSGGLGSGGATLVGGLGQDDGAHGGGGGGGAAGYVVIVSANAITTGAIISPAATGP